MIRRPLYLAGLTLLLFSLVTTALAGDDEDVPLYVVHEGKLIPTLIIPPKATAPGVARPAVLRTVELGPGTADVIGEPVPNGATVGELPDEEDIWDAPYPRWSDVGYYAGYPVSVCRHHGPRWWTYQPYLQPGYRRALEEAYRAGRYIAQRERGWRFNVRDMRRRKERVLNNHEKALRLGLEHLKTANYAKAVVALTMAAELNQGDAAGRIHLAQARMAQGHYEEAGKVLRRALQLQPKLRFISLDLPSYYGGFAEFDQHVDELAAWVKQHRAGVNTYFLLGYMEFQRENFAQAHAAFNVARRGLPRDSLTHSYLEITKPGRR